MLDFLAHELGRLGWSGLSCALGLAGVRDGPLFGHRSPPVLMIGLARPTTVRSAGTRHAGFSVFNRTRVPSTIRAAAPRSQRVRSAMTTRTPSPILLPSWPSYWLNGK